jgi:hypothetical protein
MSGRIPFKGPNGKRYFLDLTQSATAAEVPGGDSSCDKRLTAVEEAPPAYVHGALGHFNGTLYMINNVNAVNVENIFCHLSKSVGVKADISNLPESGSETETKEIEGNELKVVIEKSTDEDYTAKATVSFEGTTYFVLYWGYGDATLEIGQFDPRKSKGFLIEGFDAEGLGGYRASYLQWDLTTTTQTARVLATEFRAAEGDATITPSTAYVKNIDPSSDLVGNRAFYGRYELNTSTNDVKVQAISIEKERGTESPVGFGCFKFYALGKKDGQLITTKTRDNVGDDGYQQRGHFTVDATSSNLKTFADMDAACVYDKKDTPNLKGNVIGGGEVADRENALLGLLNTNGANSALNINTDIFDYSCDELKAFDGNGKPFDNNNAQWVNFAMTPGDVFNQETEATWLEAPLESDLCTDVTDGQGNDTTTGCYCNQDA